MHPFCLLYLEVNPWAIWSELQMNWHTWVTDLAPVRNYYRGLYLVANVRGQMVYLVRKEMMTNGIPLVGPGAWEGCWTLSCDVQDKSSGLWGKARGNNRLLYPAHTSVGVAQHFNLYKLTFVSLQSSTCNTTVCLSFCMQPATYKTPGCCGSTFYFFLSQRAVILTASHWRIQETLSRL